jgi:hypothetical protein
MAMQKDVPEFVLFGASMTEWSFDEKTHGLGWFLASRYEGKVLVLNEGTRIVDDRVQKMTTAHTNTLNRSSRVLSNTHVYQLNLAR